MASVPHGLPLLRDNQGRHRVSQALEEAELESSMSSTRTEISVNIEIKNNTSLVSWQNMETKEYNLFDMATAC